MGQAQRDTVERPQSLRGFDSYELRLGDVIRGERATMGKSLLDVQRELHIKARYLVAIENADPEAFETKGFIAGCVRSYARYLGLDPDWAYERFCEEAGYEGVLEGQSRGPAAIRAERIFLADRQGDGLANPRAPFSPAQAGLLAEIRPAAVGSVAVLVALIAGLGYGVVSVVREIQRVDLASAEPEAVILTEIDPIANAGIPTDPAVPLRAATRRMGAEELEAPVVIARDGPIATLDPDRTGALAPVTGTRPATTLAAAAPVEPVQVTRAVDNRVRLFATSPAWVRVTARDGTVLFEKILDTGEVYTLPGTEEAPTLRAGNSGALYFRVGDTTFGPVGTGASVARNVLLDAADIAARYEPVTNLAGSDPFSRTAAAGD